MKRLLFFFVFTTTMLSHAQIKGVVRDVNNTTLPAVSVFIENTYSNTTTNEKGNYEIAMVKPGKYTVVFQYLGYKTKKVTVEVVTFPYELNCALEEENFTLENVTISNKENPANQIIKNAISAKKANAAKTAQYACDFYSRGLLRIKDAPKKILGQEVGDFDGSLDSTRTGILYLSETVSKLKFQKPDKLKETIVASKVSGKDNGFSFNNAGSVDFDFYENNLPFQVKVISPISNDAFGYYKFKLESSFITVDNQVVDKIKVIPRRDVEPVVEGYIYIVENAWALYGVDVVLKGYRIQTPVIDTLNLKQTYSFNTLDNVWTKNTQTLDFTAGLFGFNVSGIFTYVYSNFEFEPKFDKKTFTNEILSIEKEANKKDANFWNTIRPVPLTEEETNDYIKKDSIQTLRKSKTYLDSIDKKHNRLSLSEVLTGYSYNNSYQKWNVKYDGFLTSLRFNTVQGYVISNGISFAKRNEEKGKYLKLGTTLNYGFSDKKVRFSVDYFEKFNAINNATFSLSTGNEIVQFNEKNPISNIVNSVSTLFFKDNYAKFYARNYIKAAYSQEIINGFTVFTNLEYSERNPLYNTTDYSILKKDKSYTSNNPLDPLYDGLAVIEKHNLLKAKVTARFNFGQQYWMRPDGKFNIPNDKYPTLFLTIEKGFAGNETKYNYDFISTRIAQNVALGNKGAVAINATVGKFFNAKEISFVDYKHFNGNQTHIGQSDRYLNQFNLLPYYERSTNDAFFELHSEYDDKGFLINKVPVLNKLKSTLVLGFHVQSLPKIEPYSEISIGLDNLGFGKFKFFRLDYVRSYQSGFKADGLVFGLKILNALD
jgi:Family of unknown function (DUF5686)/CarboxypepD_reg-like domain